ncbi:MAG TPA: alpha/beta hydrolase fold domain-containing protein [Steroidobacter sp.]|uniref:alpha/beta hydrolase fold domain-containing protein n=1 Tax=Steroidobacter sp. TaxID=1978227 RepID=UPI002EDAB87E
MSDRFEPRNPDDIRALVHEQPLAWIVSGAPGAQQATPLPVQLVCDDDGTPITLLGHFARSNPQVKALAASSRATVLLLGPNGYISPSWMRNRNWAPTWNYASVVFDVEVQFRDERADADRLLGGLVTQMEANRPAAWVPEELGARYEKLVTGIVGFEARILATRSCFKLGQDERDDVFADILRALDIKDQAPLAKWMRRFAGSRSPQALPASQPPPRALDPEIKRFIDDVIAKGRQLTAGRELTWPQRREICEVTRAPWVRGGPVIAETRNVVAQTAAGPVGLRIYDPSPGHSKPTFVFMHGGGWSLFSLNTHDRVMREFAHRGGMAVVGVDYALSPEVRYPTALNQVVALVHWLHEQGRMFGLDGERIAIGGDSAGGNLSMGAALRLRDAGHPKLVKAVLSIYGGSTPDCSPASRQRYGTDEDMLTAAEVDTFWDNYIGHVGDRRDPYAATAYAPLHGLPPVFLVIAECDILAEQNLLMAGRLLEAGVQVQAKVYPGAPHSFIEAVAVSRVANEAVDDGVAFLRSVLLRERGARVHVA